MLPFYGIISAEDPVSSSAVFGSWYHIAAAAPMFAAVVVVAVVVAAASITFAAAVPVSAVAKFIAGFFSMLFPARRILKILNPKFYVTAGNTARPTLRTATSSWCSLCGA